MDTYFSRFPTIEYDGVVTRNITERVVMVTTPRMVPTNYYPFELINGMRSDQLSGEYYGDPNLDWLVYIVNDIIDPYYGWHLWDEDFEEFIIKKYGSVEYSQQLIAFYRNNWYDNPEPLSLASYAALPHDLKRYYEPVMGPVNIQHYTRRQEDWVMSTNRIELWSVTHNATPIANGDLLVITYDTFPTGWAYCQLANATHLVVKHVIGNNDPGSVLTSWSDANASANLVAVTVLQTSIPDTEAAYWEPVAYYDVEREANENRRFVELLDSGYALETAEAIRKALIKK